ncbi:phosphatidylserine decarboxylase [Ulvibacterium sp.]|uniref:phosphatidylserine decarboxylase n=1 Tax=Ulvibacterium sp. TaxID=2665914 RepID=UPI00262CDD8C|nr:phosphatidylserine decarboxylase [Ulvibacterium sp.]
MEAATYREDDYYSDPHFTIFKVPEWRAKLYTFLSVNVWGGMPSTVQRKLSSKYASVYDKPFSKNFIKTYIRINYSDKNYLDKFKPPFGKRDFESFQDFFIREFKELPKNNAPFVWPCEGLLCDQGEVSQIETSRVKSDVRSIATIFGTQRNAIPREYTFTNVFLHNKNYHRIHAPVHGTISRIQHIPGDLIVLRPWIYKQNPSLPAFRNERYNVDIRDDKGRTWYLSIVGGPAVRTIELAQSIKVGQSIKKMEEIALFYLGSTCCMASPEAPKRHSKNSFVEVGATY